MKKIKIMILALLPAVHMGVGAVGAGAQQGCPPPVEGVYEVDARQILPFGPTWTFHIIKNNSGNYDILLKERGIEFKNTTLQDGRISGISGQNRDRINVNLKYLTGQISGELKIFGEVPGYSFSGTRKDFTGARDLQEYQSCLADVSNPSGRANTQTEEYRVMAAEKSFLEREVSTLKDALVSERASAAETRELHGKEIARLEDILARLRVELEAEKRKQASLSDDLKRVRNQSDKQASQNESLSAQLSACTENRSPSDAIADLQRKVLGLEANLKEAKSSEEARALTSQLAQARDSLKSAEIASADLRTNLEKLRGENTDLRSQLKLALDERDTLLANQKSGVISAAADVEKVGIEKDRLQTELENLLDQHAKLTDRFSRCEQKFDALLRRAEGG